LLVEDNPLDAELAIREMRKGEINYEIRLVDSLAELVKELNDFGPDLIISDYNLTGFDGMKVLNLARELDELLPVIIITGSINEETAVRCIKSGAEDYILKENLKRLPFAVKDALELRRIILEKNQAEIALKESQDCLEMFFEQSLDGFFFMMLEEPVYWNEQIDQDQVLDYIYHNQKVTRINQAMLDQYRAQPEEMISKSATDFFIHDTEQGMRVWRRLLNEGHLMIDTLEQRMDGTEMWVEGEYRCMYDREGRFIGHFGIQRDVTETKRVQESIKYQLIALTQPIDDPHGIEFDILFNLNDIQRIQDEFAEATGVASIITLPDGTPLTKPTNFCRLCNEVIRKTPKGLINCYHSDAVIGLTRNDGPVIQQCLSGGLWDAGASISVGGKHVANWLIGQVRNEAQNDEQLLLYADEIGADREEFKKALAEVPVMSDIQFAKVAKSLHSIANELSLKAYQNVQQARFILEKQESIEALKAAKVKAEESDRLKSAFLANMSHEIRTPMNSIIGFAELLTEEDVDTESRKKFAKLIESGSEQLLSLINDIIDISKIEAGQISLASSRVDVHELIEEIYQMFSAIRDRMGKDRVHLLMEIAEIENTSEIFTDRNRLRQILINLGQNALKFTDAGTIVFGCKHPNENTIQFFVKDTGIGISPIKQELIFKRFRQVDETIGRSLRGTGLGLAISKNLVHLMGGEIGVISELGQGSEFWFTLPRLAAAR